MTEPTAQTTARSWRRFADGDSAPRPWQEEIFQVRMRAPMMRIHTVAAGGGSILHFDGSRFRVEVRRACTTGLPSCPVRAAKEGKG